SAVSSSGVSVSPESSRTRSVFRSGSPPNPWGHAGGAQSSRNGRRSRAARAPATTTAGRIPTARTSAPPYRRRRTTPDRHPLARVPDGAGRDAAGGGTTGGGFGVGRAGTGARRRRLATRPATLPPSAETLAPIVDPTPVRVDHLGSGISGWNHQYAPAARPPSTSTSSVRVSARGSWRLRRGARGSGGASSSPAASATARSSNSSGQYAPAS